MVLKLICSDCDDPTLVFVGENIPATCFCGGRLLVEKEITKEQAEALMAEKGKEAFDEERVGEGHNDLHLF